MRGKMPVRLAFFPVFFSFYPRVKFTPASGKTCVISSLKVAHQSNSDLPLPVFKDITKLKYAVKDLSQIDNLEKNIRRWTDMICDSDGKATQAMRKARNWLEENEYFHLTSLRSLSRELAQVETSLNFYKAIKGKQKIPYHENDKYLNCLHTALERLSEIRSHLSSFLPQTPPLFLASHKDFENLPHQIIDLRFDSTLGVLSYAKDFLSAIPGLTNIQLVELGLSNRHGQSTYIRIKGNPGSWEKIQGHKKLKDLPTFFKDIELVYDGKAESHPQKKSAKPGKFRTYEVTCYVDKKLESKDAARNFAESSLRKIASEEVKWIKTEEKEHIEVVFECGIFSLKVKNVLKLPKNHPTILNIEVIRLRTSKS